MNTKYLFAGSMLLLLGMGAQAQDTTRKREVNVTSTFKPVLKESAKISFHATPPTADTTRPRLQYAIPNQNLSLAFQPGSLKPLALQVDTGGRFEMHNYIKAGFGNFSTPYAQVGLSLGDGKTSGLNLYGEHVSSKGKRPFQKFSNTEVEANAFLQNNRNGEWQARIGTIQERYNKYGFQPDSLHFPDDSLRVKFATIRGRIAYRNIEPTRYGINYAPEFKVDIFNDGLSNSESNTYLHLPISKNISPIFTAQLALEANVTRYKPDEKDAVSNNYVLLAPSVRYQKGSVQVQAGIKPSWDNGAFSVLPNVTAEFGIANKGFSVQLGWLGYFRSSGYQYLAGYNPWIWAPEKVYNTKIEERYAGIKGSITNHFSYSVRVGSNRLNNQPLFVNDTASGKSFLVLNESKLTNVYINGEMGYTWGEKVSFNTGLRINNFSGLRDYDKAWGLLPLEFNSRLRVQILKDLYVTADMFAFEGTRYLNKEGDNRRLKGAVDLNGGMEFRIVKNVKLWAQFNNIFGKEYQRWNQYPVYGFNFLGGVVFSFAQNNGN